MMSGRPTGPSGRNVPNFSRSIAQLGLQSRKMRLCPRAGVSGRKIGWPSANSAVIAGRKSISPGNGHTPAMPTPPGNRNSAAITAANCSPASGSKLPRLAIISARSWAFCSATAFMEKRSAEPPKPLASHPPEPACAGGHRIPRPGSRQSQPPGGCLSAPGMNCLTHPAAPPHTSRAAQGPAQSPRPGRRDGPGVFLPPPRPAAGG